MPAPAAPQGSRESAPAGSVPINPFAEGDAVDDADYDDMAGQQNQSLSQALQNPAILAQFLAQMGQSNPEMVQQLLANPGMLQQFVENLQQGEDGQDGDDGGDFEGMEEQGQQVELTPAEEATVRRMTDLGFPFQRALEVGPLQRLSLPTNRGLTFFAGISFVRSQRGVGCELPV